VLIDVEVTVGSKRRLGFRSLTRFVGKSKMSFRVLFPHPSIRSRRSKMAYTFRPQSGGRALFNAN
jgi:hypothetical protein